MKLTFINPWPELQPYLEPLEKVAVIQQQLIHVLLDGVTWPAPS